MRVRVRTKIAAPGYSLRPTCGMSTLARCAMFPHATSVIPFPAPYTPAHLQRGKVVEYVPEQRKGGFQEWQHGGTLEMRIRMRVVFRVMFITGAGSGL